MKTLVNIPGRPNLDITVYDSKVPKPEDVTIVSPALLKACIKLGEEFKELKAKWAIGGDAGELIKGVHIKTDFVEVWTTEQGVEEVCDLLQEQVTSGVAELGRKLSRDADVDGVMHPVYVRGRYAVLTVNGVRVELHGDQQIKVGEWEWGDALDFEPEYTYMVTERIPIVPLRLKQELDLGLGWLDRLELIATAIASGQHHIAQGGVRPR